MNLFNQLKHIAGKFPERVALKPSNVTYKMLLAMIERRAHELSMKLDKAIPVSLELNDTFEFIINFYALNSLSIPVAPENKDVKKWQRQKITGFHVCNKGQVDKINNVLPIRNEIALILYTSGTTGTPKPVYFTNKNLLSNCLTVANKNYKFSGDVCGLLSSPLCYILGINMQLNLMLLTGNSLYISKSRNFDEYAKILADGEINFVGGVPLFYMKLTSSLEELNKVAFGVKYALIGGASWDKRILDKIKKYLNVVPYATYGLTETSPLITCGVMHYDDYIGKYSVGMPIDGVKIKTNSACEILVKGSNVASYNTNDYQDDTWFSTGDIGEIIDNKLYILGRNKDFINKAGIKINCSVIEAKIKKLKGVIECVAAGVPSTQYIEDIGVAIMKEKSISEINFENLDRKYQPKHVVYLDDLPTINSSGKIDRKLIKEQLVSGL